MGSTQATTVPSTAARALAIKPELTVDAQRVDGIDELLVHLHGPHNPRLFGTVALAITVLAALSLGSKRHRMSVACCFVSYEVCRGRARSAAMLAAGCQSVLLT